jgi:predicted glutamine amidotransferase
MCRLVGIVASELTEFGVVLTEAPRSLATLSKEHPDGWGVAVHHAHDSDETWRLHKGTEPAGTDRRFHEIAGRSRGHVIVAHIRQKTVGRTRLENTHPFTRDGWVFAHNGTIKQQDEVRARCSSHRLREIDGETDSELFFAYVLTRLDEEGLVKLETEAARERATALLRELTAELRDAGIGAFNFLLSDGETTFAHRFGRTLYVLERGPSDPVRERRNVDEGAAILTKWTARRQAVFVASERITDEPWREVPDGSLLRIDRTPSPSLAQVERPAESDVCVIRTTKRAG